MGFLKGLLKAINPVAYLGTELGLNSARAAGIKLPSLSSGQAAGINIPGEIGGEAFYDVGRDIAPRAGSQILPGTIDDPTSRGLLTSAGIDLGGHGLEPLGKYQAAQGKIISTEKLSDQAKSYFGIPKGATQFKVKGGKIEFFVPGQPNKKGRGFQETILTPTRRAAITGGVGAETPDQAGLKTLLGQ